MFSLCVLFVHSLGRMHARDACRFFDSWPTCYIISLKHLELRPFFRVTFLSDSSIQPFFGRIFCSYMHELEASWPSICYKISLKHLDLACSSTTSRSSQNCGNGLAGAMKFSTNFHRVGTLCPLPPAPPHFSGKIVLSCGSKSPQETIQSKQSAMNLSSSL